MAPDTRNPQEDPPRELPVAHVCLRQLAAYCVALAAPGALVVMGVPLGLTARDPTYLALAALPIAVAAWLGGALPGLAATAATAALCAAFIVPASESVDREAGSALALLMLVALGALLSVGAEFGRRRLAWRASVAPSPAGRTTERRVQAAAAVWLLVLSASAGLAVLNLERHATHGDEAMRLETALQGLRRLSSLMKDFDVAESRLLLGGRASTNAEERGLAPEERRIATALRQELQHLRRLEQAVERRHSVEELDALIERRLALAGQVLDTYRQGGATADSSAWHAAASSASLAQTRIAALSTGLETGLGVRYALQSRAERTALSAVATGGGLLLLLAPLALVLIGRGFAASRRDEAALREDRDRFESRLAERARELERANESLARNEAHLRTLWDALPDPIWLKDETGRYVSVNLAAARLSGLPREELLGQTDERLFTPALAEQLRARHASVAETGQAATFDEDLQFRHDGLLRSYETTLTPLRDDRGLLLGVLGIARDTTERKRAAQALLDLNVDLEDRVAQRTRDLQMALEHARDLYDQAPCGYHSLDVDGHILDVNATELRWLGYARDELLGRPFRDLLTARSQQVFDQNFARFKQTGRVTDLEFELRRHDGTLLPTLLSATAVRNAAGVFSHSRSTLTDFTELKRARARLLEVNRELEGFNYSVSHDLKAPLRAIDGYARLLGEACAGKLDADGRHFLDSLTRAAGHMNRLIDDLLAYARIERRSTQIAATEPRSLVQALLDERSDEIRARGVQVELTVPEGTVDADREALALALRNLIDNALKFTARAEPACLSVGGRLTQSGCLLWVRDNGPGFDMQFHDRIFQIFQRLNRAEEFEGTGIGLALVRKAVQRMDGRVWAQSAPGQGATFFLEIGR